MLKREEQLPTFSFKLRGAYNKMAYLRPKDSWKGVITCSTGNHAYGVAFSSRCLKIPAIIVMPLKTPEIIKKPISQMGAKIVLYELHNIIFISAFDDPYVIAGHGTIGMEISRQTDLKKLKAIFCAVGGGGMIAGIGLYIKRLAPNVQIIGVESVDANAMAQSLRARKRVILEQVDTFSGSAAVKIVGEETFRICLDVVDSIEEVTVDETCAAIKDIYDDTRVLAEPAGALPLAGLQKWAARNPSLHEDSSLIAIVGGANMTFDCLPFITERVRASKEH
ncbi:Threonine dehydratase [Pyrenophora tritici-repentis]|uniref:IlvA, Threonine dehydratase n=1 Tax=Pyrenophora tritici-repentis TaxID=45151 RepID=A0A5M9LEW0_9PLEO|nr:Threonine dehydratase [Pyrenophora tritici-repentis]KAF7452708.1 Threonine dehydratase [Pyrenophora tritici-repentis]KAF7574110.1 IlvA, Threonine dehydratase [Pyrenophora tritici-repentis]